MLFDENKNYKEISDEAFDNEIERFKNSSEIIGTIYYYYKDKKGNIIRKERNGNNMSLENDLELVSKYYVVRIKVDEPLCFQFEDIGDAYKIYNLGNFYISELFKMNKESIEKVQKMFKQYDKNYANLSFPFTDEEFLSKYNRRNK